MSSEKQIAANRRNSQKSTGPTSVAGKAASSMNAFKTGIHAKSSIIPCERARDLQELIDEYYSAHRPATPEARSLVDDLIRCEWTLRRLDTSEASLWNYQSDQSFRPVPDSHKQGKIIAQNARTFGLIQRRLDATRRGRDRALQQLRELAAKPLSIPEPALQPDAAPLPETASEVSAEVFLDPVTLPPSATSAQNGFVPSTRPESPFPESPESGNPPIAPAS